MRVTGRYYFSEAVVTYDEKPREQWVFDYPAQCALCGTQIWWTTEVNLAFARLEEGYENALKDYQKKQVCFDSRLCYINGSYQCVIILILSCLVSIIFLDTVYCSLSTGYWI